jgi:hypothetical protein
VFFKILTLDLILVSGESHERKKERAESSEAAQDQEGERSCSRARIPYPQGHSQRVGMFYTCISCCLLLRLIALKTDHGAGAQNLLTYFAQSVIVHVESNKRATTTRSSDNALLCKSPDYCTIWNVRRTILKQGFLDNAQVQAMPTGLLLTPMPIAAIYLHLILFHYSSSTAS